MEKSFILTAFVLVTMTMFQDADFTGKPSVLLVGQYSTGKTTLIRFCDIMMMRMMIVMMVRCEAVM